jgi:hypothetical protein
MSRIRYCAHEAAWLRPEELNPPSHAPQHTGFSRRESDHIIKMNPEPVSQFNNRGPKQRNHAPAQFQNHSLIENDRILRGSSRQFLAAMLLFKHFRSGC